MELVREWSEWRGKEAAGATPQIQNVSETV